MYSFCKFVEIIKEDENRAIFGMDGKHIPDSNITSLDKPESGKQYAWATSFKRKIVVDLNGVKVNGKYPIAGMSCKCAYNKNGEIVPDKTDFKDAKQEVEEIKKKSDEHDKEKKDDSDKKDKQPSTDNKKISPKEQKLKIHEIFLNSMTNVLEELKKDLNLNDIEIPSFVNSSSGEINIYVPGINESNTAQAKKESIHKIIEKLKEKYNDITINKNTITVKDNDGNSITIKLIKDVGSAYKAEDYFPVQEHKPIEFSNAEEFRNTVLDIVENNRKLVNFRKHIKKILGTKEQPNDIHTVIEELSKCNNKTHSIMMVSFNEVILPYLLLNREKLTDDDLKKLGENENTKKIIEALQHPKLCPTYETEENGVKVIKHKKITKISYPLKSNEKLIDFRVYYDTNSVGVDTTINESSNFVYEIVSVSMKNNGGNGIGISSISSVSKEEVEHKIEELSDNNETTKEELKKHPLIRLQENLRNNFEDENSEMGAAKSIYASMINVIEESLPDNIKNDETLSKIFSGIRELMKDDSNFEKVEDSKHRKNSTKKAKKKFFGLFKDKNECIEALKSMCNAFNIKFKKTSKTSKFSEEKMYNTLPDSFPFIMVKVFLSLCEKENTKKYNTKILMFLLGVDNVVQLKTLLKSNGLSLEAIELDAKKTEKLIAKLCTKIDSISFWSKHSSTAIAVKFILDELKNESTYDIDDRLKLFEQDILKLLRKFNKCCSK